MIYVDREKKQLVIEKMEIGSFDSNDNVLIRFEPDDAKYIETILVQYNRLILPNKEDK